MSNLKWSCNNSKIKALGRMLKARGDVTTGKSVIAFDLPAGWTCPAASLCMARANRETGKITKGKDAEFLCYASKLEAAFPSARRARWHNFNILAGMANDADAMAEYILSQIPKGTKVIRIHTSGDFFNRNYFLAWTYVAIARPDITFWGYTKVLAYVTANKPDNFKLAYSMGGKHDASVRECTGKMVTSTVVVNEEQAQSLGLPVACPTPTSPDDFDFVMRGESFALLLH